MPGARRSLHPTHPCTALGPEADALIDGAESSTTPFGDASTYGRFSTRENAVLLLAHTNNTSIVHRFQEIVHMPNLFMPDQYAVRGRDRAGTIRTYSLRVHTPSRPLYVAVGGDREGEPEYIWLPDYAVQFPRRHAARIFDGLHSAAARQSMRDRQQLFFDTGVFRAARHGMAELLSIRVRPWQDRICQDLRRSIETFSYADVPGAVRRRV
jgi:hypothetical protein